MCPDKPVQYYQPQLALPKKAPLQWHQLPEANRVRCRELLLQMLRQAVMNPAPERNSHERQT